MASSNRWRWLMECFFSKSLRFFESSWLMSETWKRSHRDATLCSSLRMSTIFNSG